MDVGRYICFDMYVHKVVIQVTNYGLGGLVEDHNDPYGYNEGTRLSPELSDLAYSGDIMATVMGKY